jgi:hypothetical protein
MITVFIGMFQYLKTTYLGQDLLTFPSGIDLGQDHVVHQLLQILFAGSSKKQHWHTSVLRRV